LRYAKQFHFGYSSMHTAVLVHFILLLNNATMWFKCYKASKPNSKHTDLQHGH
jgi:hypothetical protein